MKRVDVILIIILLLALTLSACGGGDGNQAPPTAVGTPVNLMTVKAYQSGTAPAGAHLDFTLTGSDTQGSAWTGSYSIVSDGATTFEGNAVTKARALMTFTRTSTGVSATGNSTSYFLVSDGSLYKTVGLLNTAGLANITGTPTSKAAVPDSAKVGDSGNLWAMTYSNNTSSSSTWRLDPDYNGNSRLVSSTTIKDASNAVSGLGDETIYLDANGFPFRMEEKVMINGVTVTLAGNRV